MQYRNYGVHGPSISILGAGCMRLKTPETDRDLDEQAEVLLYAYDQGVNYFDTAPLYCGDRSEEMVGRAIKQMKPGTFYVSSKSSKATATEFRASLERSLDRLGVSQIDFFHVWCLLRASDWPTRKEGGVLEAALKAREEGLIGHLVFSTHLTGKESEAVISEGCFEGVTLGYNAINFPYRERAVMAAHKAGLGVVTMNPLAGGLIPQQAERFDFLREPQDADVVTAALRFNWSTPGVTCALVGFSSATEVDMAVQALDGFSEKDPAEFERLKAHIPSGFEGLCTGCGYCLPCPVGIPIPKLMDAKNMQILGGGESAVLNRLKWHWDLTPTEAGICVQCGQCEAACTQHLPIIERLAEIAALGRAP